MRKEEDPFKSPYTCNTLALSPFFISHGVMISAGYKARDKQMTNLKEILKGTRR